MRAMTGRFGQVARGGAVLGIVLLVATSAAVAQEHAMGDGIKVHGHWTIDVKNPLRLAPRRY
jgi:hypothetical protein